MAIWNFFEFIDETGRNLTAEWYASQEADVRTKFDATLFILAATPDWGFLETRDGSKALFKILKNHKGLGEIRFGVRRMNPINKKQFNRKFRPVGIWPPTRQFEFILILSCEKIRMTYKPNDAFRLAEEYAKMLAIGKGTIHERF